MTGEPLTVQVVVQFKGKPPVSGSMPISQTVKLPGCTESNGNGGPLNGGKGLVGKPSGCPATVIKALRMKLVPSSGAACPLICFVIGIVPFSVFVKVQVTVSPAAKLIIAVSVLISTVEFCEGSVH